MSEVAPPTLPDAMASRAAAPFLGPRAVFWWRVVQVAVWLVGAGIFAALILRPAIGLHAFWNVLIPVAPALLAFAVGLWRNICPLASTVLLPRHMGASKRLRLSAGTQGTLALLGTAALLLIVPLRHTVLDTNGPATALVLGLLAALGVTLGFFVEWKSGWCSGLCPVHPVEKLYGQQVALTVPNAHCDLCHRCVAPCPDSTPAVHPLSVGHPWTRGLAGLLLAGGFAGYIVGWFFVPDYADGSGWQHLGVAYGRPFLGMAISLALFLLLRVSLPARHRGTLILGFAAAAISAYYWFRLPALFGFGPYPGDGSLVDLRDTLPAWFPWISRFATTALFAWWFLLRRGIHRAWGRRPTYAPTAVGDGAAVAGQVSGT